MSRIFIYLSIPFVALVVGLGLALTTREEPSAGNTEDHSAPLGRSDGMAFYASPDGRSDGNGSREQPWDLATALNGKMVPPGSTIWLRGGVYRGAYTSFLKGTQSAPITVRQYQGERAIIDGNGFKGEVQNATLTIYGGWAVYWGFEVMNSSPDRSTPGSRPFRPGGVDVNAPHTKFINLTIHDTGMGYGFWKDAVDSEIYGNIIFNCGSQNTPTDMRSGHAIYTQNNSGTKLIADNIMFNQFGWGIHAYPHPGALKGYRIEGNVLFNNGIMSGEEIRYNNILVSNDRAERITISNNFLYNPRTQGFNNRFHDANICLGCSDPIQSKDVEFSNNYMAGGDPVAFISRWENVTFKGNFMYGPARLVRLVLPQSLRSLLFKLPVRIRPTSYQWDNNTYSTDSKILPFEFEGKNLDLADWRQATGFDQNSQYSPVRPRGVKVFIRPNQYEQGRANIIIYNWDLRDSVDVDVSSVLQKGSPYEVRNVQDYLGPPMLAGTYDGRPLRLPMTGTRVATAYGKSSRPESTGPEFNAFVLSPPSGVRAGAVEAEPGNASPGAGRSRRRTITPDRATNEGDLGKFVGRYISKRPPAEISIEMSGGRLQATILNEPGHPVYTLAPVSPTRFVLEGAPEGFGLQFDIARGKVRSLTALRGRFPSVTLFPSGR